MIAVAFKRNTGGLFDRSIAWKTKSQFVHAELVLAGPLKSAECFSSRQPNGTGFAYIDLTDSRIWTVVALPVTQRQSDALQDFCDGCGHKSYDWLGILGFVLPWGEHDDHDRFCSEICTEALQKMLGCWPDVKSWETSPMDLYELVVKRGIDK